MPTLPPFARGSRDKYGGPWIHDELLDQYSVDEDQVLDELAKFISGTEWTSIGQAGTMVECSKYTCLLGDAARASAGGALETDKPED